MGVILGPSRPTGSSIDLPSPPAGPSAPSSIAGGRAASGSGFRSGGVAGGPSCMGQRQTSSGFPWGPRSEKSSLAGWGYSGPSRKAGPTSDAHIPSQAEINNH